MNDKLPSEINHLIYLERGLNGKEINYIKKMLKVDALRMIINLRYPPDPIRYDTMRKKNLLNELKYSRYE